MEQFITWDILTTYATFVTIVFMVVEFTKSVFMLDNSNSFIFLLVGSTSHFFTVTSIVPQLAINVAN